MLRLLFAAAKTYVAVKAVEYVAGAFSSAPNKRAAKAKSPAAKAVRRRAAARHASRPAMRRKAAA